MVGGHILWFMTGSNRNTTDENMYISFFLHIAYLNNNIS